MKTAIFVVVAAILACFAFATEKHSTKCSLTKHIKKSDWTFDGMRDYKGNRTYERPLPSLHPFTNSTEQEINKQINRELFAHYTYLSMAYHFQRDDISLPSFHKFFMKQAEEEHKHAQLLMDYQNKRGGRIKLNNISKPCEDEWGSGLDAMKAALNLEKDIYVALLGLHGHASEENDPQLTDFIESHFLNEQIDSIAELSKYVNTLKRLGGDGLGEYLFDKHNLA